MKSLSLNDILDINIPIVSVSIVKLSLNLDEKSNCFTLNLFININSQSKKSCVELSFFQVENFSVKNLFYESELYGFLIVDHSDDQYQNNSRFEILDYENERIHFYCKQYTCKKRIS